MSQIVLSDNYSFYNVNSSFGLPQSTYLKFGHTFSSIGGYIDSIILSFLTNIGTPSSNAFVEIYDVTGTVGVDAVPSGTPIAISDPVLATDCNLTTGVQFSFTGENRIRLSVGGSYAFALSYSFGDSSNYIRIGTDTSSENSGNDVYYASDTLWEAYAPYSLVYEIYEEILDVSKISGVNSQTISKISGVDLSTISNRSGITL